MKKICLLLGTLLIFGATAYAFNAGGFNDLKGNEWFANAANFAFTHHYINGTNDGNFAPRGPVTRDQIAVMLQKFAYNVNFQVGSGEFVDSWYGFKMRFPDSWRGYLVETSHFPAYAKMDIPGPITEYGFGLLNNHDIFENLFTVSVWKTNDWTAHKPNEVEKGLVVGGNTLYTVTLTPVEGGNSKELNRAAEDVLNIREAFVWQPIVPIM